MTSKVSKYPRLPSLEPYPGESLTHYLGRFRRKKSTGAPSPSALGQIVGIGGVVAQWEQGFFNPFPTIDQLTILGTVIGLDVDRLTQMLQPAGVTLDPRPIRLCAACYQESPYHRIAWQLRSTKECERHKLKLLMKCPGCETLFPVPSRWVDGKCQNKKCGMRYSRMAKHQAII